MREQQCPWFLWDCHYRVSFLSRVWAGLEGWQKEICLLVFFPTSVQITFASLKGTECQSPSL